MATTTTNLGLKVWNLSSDTFNYNDLVFNWNAIDADYTRPRAADRVEVLSSLPGSGLFDGRLVYLSAAASGFSAKTLVRYNGTSWRAVGPIETVASIPSSSNHQGRIVVLTAAAGGFAANDVIVNIDGASSWKKVGGIPSGTTLPGTPVAGDAFVTTTATGGFDAFSLVVYNGTAWTRSEKRGLENGPVLPGVPYTGQVFTLTAPVSNFNAYDVIRYNGSAWERVGNPAGTILQYVGDIAPSGYLLCDGAEVQRTVYPGLDAVISTRFGAYTNGSGGAGTTHMVLPDLRGRIPVGKGLHGDVSTIGNNDGSTVTSRRPKHKHITTTDTTGAHSHTINIQSGGNNLTPGGTTYNMFPTDSPTPGLTTGTSGSHTHNVTVGPQTGAEPTDGPSYLTVNYIIKT